MFRRTPPPLWYVLHPSDKSDKPPRREGPYKRTAISHLIAADQLPSSALLWTNEKIFPNPEKPRSTRKIRIADWRRLDQLPDPIVRELEKQAQFFRSAASNPEIATESFDDEQAPAVPSREEFDKMIETGTNHVGGGGAGPGGSRDFAAAAAPAAGSYPAGRFTTGGESVYPKSSSPSAETFGERPLSSVYPQPLSDKPQPGAYPQ